MSDWVAYHNEDVMGAPARQLVRPSLVTNKRTGIRRGDRVYVLTGKGRPRAFELVCRFTVTNVVAGPAGWRFRVRGDKATVKWPRVVVSTKQRGRKRTPGWFVWLQRRARDFASGPTRIFGRAVRALDRRC